MFTTLLLLVLLNCAIYHLKELAERCIYIFGKIYKQDHLLHEKHEHVSPACSAYKISVYVPCYIVQTWPSSPAIRRCKPNIVC